MSAPQCCSPSGVSVPSSPVDIGPGLVMAQDNTLGAYSPYEGRIYAAFVGYINVKVDGFTNPTSNTDIFLTYSDNDGRTWSTPVEVNDDSCQVRRLHRRQNETNPNDEVDGNSQYQPEVAVDPTTGTLVISWRDARDDPSEHAGGDLHRHQHRRRQHLQCPGLRQPRANGDGCDHRRNGRSGPGGRQRHDRGQWGQLRPTALVLRWAWPSMPARSTRFGLATSTGPFRQLAFPAGNALSIYYQPMVIAAGPRIVSSTMGPVAASTTTFSGTLTTGSSVVTGVVQYDGPVCRRGYQPAPVSRPASRS